MSYYLFLDDERNPEDVTWVNLPNVDWVIVRTQDEFEDYIMENGMFKFCSFDNDLGVDNGEGRYCVKWLVDQMICGKLDMQEFEYTVHSKNPIAKDWINSYLKSFFGHINNG